MEQGKGWSPYLYSLMARCWNAVPQRRPTFAQLVLELEAKRESLGRGRGRGRGQTGAPMCPRRVPGPVPVSDAGYEMSTMPPPPSPTTPPTATPRAPAISPRAPAAEGSTTAERQERARATSRGRLAAVAEQRSSEA